ncbi:MAG: HAMP domain-containing histidine kinase [Gemmatimonadetes bacterium]|nr:HAMP domain-containing histidine kinase [Gemmatimonadota bacterium]
MRIFDRPPAPPARSTYTVALLLLTLVLAGVLAYEAQESARSHRATAERTLRDYAGFAAFQFARYAKQGISSTAWTELAPAEQVSGDPLPPPEFVRKGREGRCKTCPRLRTVHSYFRLDLRDGSLATTGPHAGAAAYRWLADTLARVPALAGEPYQGGAIIHEVGGAPVLFTYMLRSDSAGRPLFAYGFETGAGDLAPVFNRIVDRAALLPPSLTRDVRNDSLLSITVLAPGGRVVYRSARAYPQTFAGSDTVGRAYGGYRVRVALRPSAAGRLVIGGLPRSRLPLLLGLVALTAGLIVVTLFQIRRQSELSRLRSDFVSGVSHELRTPLAQIRMFAETLLLGRVRSPEEQRRSLEIIDQEARRLAHLVENILHFSRAERRATRIAPVPTPLAPEIRETVEGFAPMARSRQTELRLELAEGVVAPVDRGALRQVLLNLVDNALKYGPPGQTVTIGMEVETDRARIRVDDQGPGIPVADRRRIWDPYRRLERDTESAVGGSGIGLAVVRELVTLHGGIARVEDAPGGGARFVLEFPGATTAPVPAPRERSSGSEGAVA